MFNTRILKIRENFKANKVILCDDKELPWVYEESRLLIKQKDLMIRTQRKNNNFDIGTLDKLSEDLKNATRNSKFTYYRRLASEINYSNSASITDWSILKSFVNGKKITLR